LLLLFSPRSEGSARLRSDCLEIRGGVSVVGDVESTLDLRLFEIDCRRGREGDEGDVGSGGTGGGTLAAAEVREPCELERRDENEARRLNLAKADSGVVGVEARAGAGAGGTGTVGGGDGDETNAESDEVFPMEDCRLFALPLLPIVALEFLRGRDRAGDGGGCTVIAVSNVAALAIVDKDPWLWVSRKKRGVRGLGTLLLLPRGDGRAA
jgi:hypothetical protein